MSSKDSAKTVSLKEISVAFQYLAAVSVVCSFGFLVLKFPNVAADSVRNSISMCFESVIPSLFPFMVISSFYSQSKLSRIKISFLDKITTFFFKQSGVSTAAIILSQIGGYPVGAKTISSMYENGLLSRQEAQRLLLFCVNPGPAFVIGYVGAYLLNSAKFGIIIYSSVLSSSLILGVLTRFLEKDDFHFAPYKAKGETPSFIDAFVSAGASSAKAMGSICIFVVIFSLIISMVSLFNLSSTSTLFLSCLLEVTNGCVMAVGKIPPEAFAAIIAWGGVCVHFQIMSYILKLQLKLKYFYTSRIIAVAFSMIICKILLTFFPCEISCVSLGYEKLALSSAASIPVSVVFILSCIIFLLGNRFVISTKQISQAVEKENNI